MLAYALVRSDCHVSKEVVSGLGVHLDFKAKKITIFGLGHDGVMLTDRRIRGMHCPTRQHALVERVTLCALATEVG